MGNLFRFVKSSHLLTFLFHLFLGEEPYAALNDLNDVETAILNGSKLEKPAQCPPKMLASLKAFGN
jgi:hypothetical protein